MTASKQVIASRLANIEFAIYRAGTSAQQTPAVRAVYESVYAEPPYFENAQDVDDFIRGWASRQRQPGFRLVIARHDCNPIGFAFGHDLTVGTRWWSGPNTFTSDDVTREYPGRTFAVIELAVMDAYRLGGVGHELHTLLLAGLPNERVTLLVRPEAQAALEAYRAWGYVRVEQIQPFEQAPTYNAMVLAVNEPSTSAEAPER